MKGSCGIRDAGGRRRNAWGLPKAVAAMRMPGSGSALGAMEIAASERYV